ncbi:MAG: hypothetical protein WCI04_04975 [archaeon]
MQKSFFMKEPISASLKLVSLITLNQKQLKDAISFAIHEYLTTQKIIILVSLSTPFEEIQKMIPQEAKNKVFVIDCFSNRQITQNNVIFAGSPSELTNIQVGIETIEKQMPGEKVIIFDALNVMAVYNNPNELGRFFHLLTNKMMLKGNTTIILNSKDATEEEILSMIKSFCDKSYDYSDMIINSITQIMCE